MEDAERMTNVEGADAVFGYTQVDFQRHFVQDDATQQPPAPTLGGATLH